jgi:hypothetical protein
VIGETEARLEQARWAYNGAVFESGNSGSHSRPMTAKRRGGNVSTFNCWMRAGALLLVWTTTAVIAATVIADVIHEGLGHGGMCAATGGRPLALSTVHFECSADTRLVAAGGTLANLIFGALFWAAARSVKQTASWRYFFWLLMTFNLFQAGGYFLFSGIGNIGDRPGGHCAVCRGFWC